MKLTGKSRVLLSAFVVLLLIQVFGSKRGDALEELPKIPAFKDSSVERVEIRVGPAEKVALKRTGEDSWEIEQPIQGVADALAIDTVLDWFKKGVSMDVLVDSSQEDIYGLSNTDRIEVGVFGVNDVPLAAFAVGWDAPGGASFVSLPNNDSVYRAKLGGRGRYQKTGAEWRNKMVMQMDWESVRSMRFERSSSQLDFRLLDSEWVLSDEPDFELDQKGLRQITQSLSKIRASQLLSADFDAGFSTPESRVVLGLEGGEERVLIFGNLRVQGAAFVRVEGEEQAYRVSAMKRDITLGSKGDYRSLQVLQTSPIELVSVRMEAHDGYVRELARKDNQLWEVVFPANASGNLTDIAMGLNRLCTLRAEGVHSGFDTEPGFEKPRFVFGIEHRDGLSDVIRVGNLFREPNTGRPMFFLEKEGEEALFVVRASDLAQILKAFNRPL